MKMRNFVAVDVETASSDLSSICQIGVASFEAGLLISTQTHLTRPASRFTLKSTSLHGITAQTVLRSPSWGELYPEVKRRLAGQNIVSHTLFDRKAIFKACSRSGAAMFSYVGWHDSCRIARRAWPHLASHSLISLAEYLGLRYRAHDAGDDARVAGMIFLHAQQAISVNASHTDLS